MHVGVVLPPGVVADRHRRGPDERTDGVVGHRGVGPQRHHGAAGTVRPATPSSMASRRSGKGQFRVPSGMTTQSERPDRSRAATCSRTNERTLSGSRTCPGLPRVAVTALPPGARALPSSAGPACGRPPRRTHWHRARPGPSACRPSGRTAAARSRAASGSARAGRRTPGTSTPPAAASQIAATRANLRGAERLQPGGPRPRGAVAGAACSIRRPRPARRCGRAPDWRIAATRRRRTPPAAVQPGTAATSSVSSTMSRAKRAMTGSATAARNRGVTRQQAAVGHGGMRAVQEPELATLERGDVVHQLHADFGQVTPVRPPPARSTIGAARSRRPPRRPGRVPRRSPPRPSSVGAGTMRSTTELGKRTSRAIHAANAPSTRSASSRTRARRTAPLSSRLSSDGEDRRPPVRPAAVGPAPGRSARAPTTAGRRPTAPVGAAVVPVLGDGQRHELRWTERSGRPSRRPVRSSSTPARRPPGASARRRARAPPP